MADQLKDELLYLQSCISGADPHGAHERVGNIGQICLYEVSPKNIDYCFSLLFDREFGVASYLRTTVDRDEFQDSKSDILEMLQALISKFNRALLSYALDIKVACVSLFTRDKASKVKNAVIPLLIELLRLCVGSDICKDLEVKAMIEKFMMELTKPVSKHSATVRGNLYHILGIFAELFPELMVTYSNRILETLVTNLKNEMTSKTKKPEMSIISGSLLGLTALLTNFSHSADEGAKHSYDIYKFTRMALDVNIKHARYDVPRAALQMLSKHSCQFGRYLMDEYEKMYDILRFWSGHHNRELLHLGTSAFEAFLKQISSMLVSQAKDGRKDFETFKFFIKKFREIMNDHAASSKSVSLAIRGYGHLSAPCRVFLSTDDVRFMYTEMMQRSEQIYFGQTGNLEDKLMSLPSFLEAFSCIVMELEQMNDAFLSSLEKLVVLMIENYPRLHQKVHFICFLSIIRIYFAVGRKGAVSHGFLSRTIYQGLIRTCSHPILLESVEKTAEADVDDEPALGSQPRLSYRDYLPFWNALLDLATMKELSQMGLSLEERDVLSQETYDGLMTAIVAMLSRLDLTSTKSSSDDVLQGGAEMASVAGEEEEDVKVSSDPVHGLNATKPSDFVIFINLVDFCRDVLVHKKVELFQRWVYKFGRDIIIYSTRTPLVSGLYKLLTVCFQICAKISYFEGLSSSNELKPKKESSESMDVDTKDASDDRSDSEERRACQLLFSKFVTEVSVQTRRYRDDLLSSCLIMILALPDEILIHHLDTVTPALQRALVIGRSYLPLAKIALSTLEHWCRTFPSSLLEPRYKDVLPLLDAYLKSVEDSAAAVVSSATERTPSGKRTGKNISLKVKRNRTKPKSKAEEDTELSVVRLQCVSLLGQLGGSINNVLVTHSGCQVSKAAVAWDVEKHLKFDVPFVDLKPTIYFDPFLPRVVELATSSSDRRTKVAACELLHSLVLFMVGRGATQVAERSVDRRHCMALLFKKVFPAIMQLACDVDQVSRQLFEPLMQQLIHWFTGYKVSQSQETLTLLEAIMEGLVNAEDSALRDFSAICLREFLRWTIKQATKEEIEKSPFSIKAMLKRFYSLARHPNAFKRLGAALGLNNIYTIFREEESLIDIFIFEMLVTFVESLAMAHADDKALGTQLQCKLVISHLEKVIKVKAQLLSKSTKLRRKPKSWADGDFSSMLDWLLLQCGRPQTECRHSAMDLVYKLATSLPDCKTAKDFFGQRLKKNGPAYFVERFERECYKLSKGQKSGFGGLRRPKNRDTEFSLKAALNWFELVLAALDCYNWVFGQDLLDPKALFTEKGGSVLFEVLRNFVDEFAFKSLEELSRKAKGSNVFTPKETETFDQAKCTVVVRILNFFSILFGRYGKEVEQIVPGGFFTPDIWRLIIACIVEPTSIGFNMADVEVMTKLPEETSTFLSSLRRSASRLCLGFQNILIVHLKSKDMLDLRNQLPAFASEGHSDRLSLRHLLHAYVKLHANGYLAEVDCGRVSSAFIEHSFQTLVMKTRDEELLAKHLSPADLDLMTDCLNLGFALQPDLTKVVSDLLFDKTPVKSTLSSGGSVSAHGELFYTTFKSVIDNYLLTEAQTAVPVLVSFAGSEQNVVGAILTGLLDVVAQKASLRHVHGSRLVDVLLGEWSKLSVWWQGEAASIESKSLTLTLLTKVVIVEPKAVRDVGHKAFCVVFTMYCDLLGDRNLSMAVKIRALDLLMFFVDLPEPHLTQLRNVLDRFVTDNFPMKSTEFPVGSPKYNEYTGALDKILLAVELSASPVLLQLLISILCREKQHVYEETIQRTLVKMMKRLRADKQTPCLDVPFRIFQDEGSLTDDQRRSCLERVCLPLLRASRTMGLVEFFSDHIQEILSAIEAKDIKAPDSAAESQLMTKTCCFLLVDIMYSCLSKDEVHSKNSRINSVYCKQKPDLAGNEMTKMLTKVANAVKSEDMRGETKHLELRRQLHCAAYNALIAVISRTQTEIKFYNGFLFAENPAKGQFVWENLIDQTRKYDFQVEMETALVRKKRYVAIRSENRELREQQLDDDDDEEMGGGGRRPASVHYLASQYLTESSLNTDVSQFDFAGSIALLSRSGSLSESQTGAVRLKKKGTLTKKEGSLQESFSSSDGFVELEMDSLNQHESMASLTSLISHMNHNVKVDKDSKEMPGWMNNLLQKFSTADDCHLNVKLFLAKVILNSEEVFRPFARSWMSPLIGLITRTSLGDNGINYLVNDIVVMLLSWHTVYKPQADPADRTSASRLLQFLMKHCRHDNQQVLRNNLEVLKTLVEVWRDCICVPTVVLYENFKEPDPKSRRNAAGVQMVGVVVANGLLPFQSCPEVDKDSFYKMLALNMTNEQKMVYSAAAEVIGMTLKLLSDAASSFAAEKEWVDQYIENVSSMMMRLIDEKRRLDNFITCVHRMQLHYPPISDRFLAKVLYVFPKVYGIFKAHCLEIIQNRIDHIPNVFLELKSKGFVDLLSQRDETTQLVSLRVVHAMLRHLKESELMILLPSLVSFASSPSGVCRLVMYDVFIWIYDNYRGASGDTADQILAKAKETLLKGLSDDDEKNRLHVHNFWTHETRLPSGTLNRLTAILEAMYSPETEDNYLSYATNFMMELTSKSPDFNREIFDQPLSECKFLDYKIQSSWYQRHAAMTPLFVETQLSTQLAPSGHASVGASVGSVGQRQVRMTQDVTSFAPTQASVGRGPYNWLTQNSLDVSSSSLMDISSVDEDGGRSSSGQSSLLFTVGRSTGGKKLQSKAVPPDFGRERLGKKEKETDERSDGSASDILNLKRRFVKSKEESSKVFFMKRQTRLTQQREHQQQQQRQRREHQVTMYRSYRIGDLPDIQIKHSFIIAPLQGLAQRDSTVAKLLFSSLFKSIFDEIEKEKTEKEAETLVTMINQALNEMLSNTLLFLPPFLGFILDVALSDKKRIRLDPTLVRQCCITGSIQPLGILLLEENIAESDNSAEEPPQAKRARGLSRPAAAPKNTSTWIELARLYKSVGEYDVVCGIFGNQLGTGSITKEAIEAEMRKDYQAAAKLYVQGLCEKNEDEANDLEMDFWEESRLQCYDRLGQWDKLEEACHHHLDIDPSADEMSLDVVWDSEINQETFLPSMIRSKLKLLLLSSKQQQTFLNFLDRALKNPERKIILELKYCEELALLYLWQDDYDRANHYAAMAIDVFFQDWSGLNDLMAFSRLTKLQGLQKLTELREFLRIVKTDGGSLQSLPQATGLLTDWTRRQPDRLLDPPSIWDDVITNRCVYSDHLMHRLKQEKSVNIFERYEVMFRLQQVDAARKQNIFSLALRLLKSTRPDTKDDVELYVRWTEAYAKTHHQRATHLSNLDPTEKIKTLSAVKDLLDKVGQKHAMSSEMQRRQNQLVAETLRLATDVLTSTWFTDYSTASDEVRSTLASIAGCKASTPDEVLVSLVERGFQLSQRAVSDVKAVTSESSSSAVISTDAHGNLAAIQKAHMAFFRYCDRYLRQADDDDNAVAAPLAGCPSFTQFPSAVVTSLLTAMKLDSRDARMFFPRLLQVIATSPDVIPLFIKHSLEVPSWMFLGWISQMTAILDRPESPAVHDILTDIANRYPAALVYPFKLSSEGYKIDRTLPDAAKLESFIIRLKEVLSRNHLIDRLICELGQFDQPNIIFKDWMNDYAALLSRKNADAQSRQNLFEDLHSRLIGRKSSSAELFDDGSPTFEFGPYWKTFQKKFVPELEKMCGRNGTNLSKMSGKEFVEKAKKILDDMAKACESIMKPPVTVKDYSPWLAEFQGSLFDEEVEIPGQYSGLKKPMPEYHTKIAGFQETVLVMTSIRRPKRVVIRGNDEKDYKFLVKCGEDLRQDQRIEILFDLMNDIFDRDATCRQMALHVRTYQVVPMTTRVGILEWMDHTVPLKVHIEDMLPDKDKILETVKGDHYKAFGATPKDYMASYKRLSRSDVVTGFRRREGMIPFDLLRRAYQKMSASPEAFYSLRMNFARTHSQLCVCHYLLGIGDRHQSNYMIDLDTGSMVGIDFGHAFGSATQFLNIPEMVPFRLTRQIRNLMQPMREKGLMEGVMIHTLKALREHADILLSTMDVFIKEPSLDWKQNAERQKKQMTGDEIMKLEVDESWYPKQKIEVARRKLNGDNCAHIMRSELRLGHAKAPYLRDLEVVLMGEATRNARASCPEYQLSVEQQVACLIDLATDPNILGRFWIGWEPWM